jgi:hypothetical protein
MINPPKTASNSNGRDSLSLDTIAGIALSLAEPIIEIRPVSDSGNTLLQKLAELTIAMQ